MVVGPLAGDKGRGVPEGHRASSKADVGQGEIGDSKDRQRTNDRNRNQADESPSHRPPDKEAD